MTYNDGGRIMKCVVCGKEFKPIRANQKTCSKECRDKKNREYARNSNEQRKHLEVIKCIVCGKEFKQTHGSQTMCSEECRKEYRRQYHENLRRMKPHTCKISICSECGKEFENPGGKRLTCSPECRKARARKVQSESRRQKRQKDRYMSRRTKRGRPLSKIAAAARDVHMTYGQYVAKYGI